MHVKEEIDITDVLVLGGGISGTMAAIAAARCGASVLLIERDGCLGGNMTAGGVGPMATFHSGSKQIIRGLMQELIDRLVAKGKSPGYAPDASNFVATVIAFDAEAMKVELESMLLEAGGRILFHTMLADVSKENDTITSITICNKAGLSKLRAKVYVDASGDADLSFSAGVPCTFGRTEDGLSQPMAMMCKFSGVDTEKLRTAMINDEANFERMHRNIDLLKNSNYISIAQGFSREVALATERNELHIHRADIAFAECGRGGEFIVNATCILHYDATDPSDLSMAEIEGRKQVQELDHFFHKYIPGFEHAILTGSGSHIGIRSSRQIRGVYTLTQQDILENRTFDDVVCYCAYPVDIHSPADGHMQVVFPKHKLLASVPFSCMVTNEIANLIVTGRCISATFEAQAAVRISATVGAMGHAAGVAAAYVAKTGCAAKDVDIKAVQTTLLDQGAYLGL
jgi:hypothetical protein